MILYISFEKRYAAGMERAKIVKLVVSIALILFSMSVTPQAWAAAEGDMILLRAAHRGNADAMRRIGMRMYRGCSVGNRSTGIQWLEKAAGKGDAEAMYLLGRIYAAKNNRELSDEYLKKAADRGSIKAVAYLEKKEKAAESKEGEGSDPIYTNSDKTTTQVAKPAINTCSVEKAAQDMASEIRKGTEAAQVKTVAMVDFLCNGGAKNKLTDAVRDKVQEALLNGNGPDLVDRKDVAMLAQEGGAQGEAVSPQASTAVLMGEVICQPGGDIGYLIYRVFHTMNMRILAAGFIPVKWNDSEKRLLNGSSSRTATAELPFILQDKLKGMVSKVKSRVSCGIAMVHDGGAVASNTVENRAAFAQILAALHQGGCVLYEREFFQQAATEASTSGQGVMPEKVGALAKVQLTPSSGSENSLKLQITAYPNSRLLSIVTLTQQRGAAIGSMVGNNDENNLDARLAELNKEVMDVQLVYEYECAITDDYTIPVELFGDKEKIEFSNIMTLDGDSDYSMQRKSFKKGAVVDAATFMEELIKVAYKKTGNKESVKKALEAAALIGGGEYVGPLQLCLTDAKNHLKFRAGENDVQNLDIGSFIGDISEGKQKISGKIRDQYRHQLPAFTYESEITWQEGLPLKAKCRIDFTPSKAKLLKKEDQN